MCADSLVNLPILSCRKIYCSHPSVGVCVSISISILEVFSESVGIIVNWPTKSLNPIALRKAKTLLSFVLLRTLESKFCFT